MAGKTVVPLRRGQFGEVVPARDSRLSKRDAKALAAVANRLLSQGRYSVDAMVDEARSKNSPIHHLLDWNIKRAAAWAWRERMRLLMHKVEVIVHTSGGDERVRWLHTIGGGSVAPRSFAIDVATVSEAEEIIEQAWRDALYVYEKYHALARAYPRELRPFSAFIREAEKLRTARQAKSA